MVANPLLNHMSGVAETSTEYREVLKSTNAYLKTVRGLINESKPLRESLQRLFDVSWYVVIAIGVSTSLWGLVALRMLFAGLG